VRALLALLFLSGGTAVAQSADDFRAAHAADLDALLQRLLASPETWAPGAAAQKLLDDLDRACRQRDCLLSRPQWWRADAFTGIPNNGIAGKAPGSP
jgi:hypothetical protein